MKKRVFKIFSLLFVFALLLTTGCATVGNISNDYDGVIYNGGQTAQVGDYLYFANSYKAVDSNKEDYAYSANSEVAYLNRINVNQNFGNKLHSPKGSEKVNSKVVGYENQYMFVLGDFIYFTSPNTHKVTDEDRVLHNAYDLVSLFRSRLNGDGFEELLTTENFDASKSQFRVLQGYDKEYYLIVFDGTDLMSLKLGNKVGGKVVIAEDVQSLAMPNETDSYEFKEILYTIKSKENDSEVEVYSYNYASGTRRKASAASEGTKFVGRDGDDVFYTNTSKTGAYQTYKRKLLKNAVLSFTGPQSEVFYDTANITNITRVSSGDAMAEGYVFVGGNSKSLMYKNTRTNETAQALLTSDAYSNLLFVDGDYVYYSSTTGLYRISVKNKQAETIIEMTDILDSKASHSGNYIYFYAKLQKDELDDNEYEEDDNYYLYRVQKERGIGGYQILSTFERKIKTEE